MWQPIDETTMWGQLQTDIENMSSSVRLLLPALSRPLTTLDCERGQLGKIEKLFVVIRTDEKVLIYDDVEDEYAIADIPSTGVLRVWQLFGPLEAAVLAFYSKSSAD